MIHLQDEQFDGGMHPWCGRGTDAVTSSVFEATAPQLRCIRCSKEWFPAGQPEWHYLAAVKALPRILQAELREAGSSASPIKTLCPSV
jgi:hypothetical protein